MRTNHKNHDESPFDVLTELAVEGTSSLIETQRTLLDLAQRENDVLLNGLKEHMAGFVPGIAMTDMVQRSVETLIAMQQDLLTTTSRQTMRWLETEKEGKPDPSHLVELAREAVETFGRAQTRLLEVLAHEAERATDKKHTGERKPANKTEIAVLAREAATAFIEAQKRLLDVMSQQMNVNLDLSAKSIKMMSPSRLMPVANLAEEGVKNFFQTESSLIGSLIKPHKPKVVGRAKPGRNRTRQPKVAAV